MNDAAHDDLRDQIRLLEQENGMLRQGVQQSTRMRRLWEQAIEELQATKQQLERSNTQLAVLHRVGSAIHQTLDAQPLFDSIMEAMASALCAACGRPMGIFLVEGDRLRLVAARGTDDEFAIAHRQLRVGECLCGAAAAHRDLVVSSQCLADPRHTLAYRYPEPHGHVVVPLSSHGKTVGVFFYFLPPEVQVDEQQRETFVAIGKQLGLAIEHARLFEETRNQSLHDPLTGLGNRRHMDRVLDGELARAKRYDRPLSVLLVDIDLFKQYNDTHGHLAGDGLLAQIGALLARETRDHDVAVRYGGEEFLMVLPETPLAGALRMAERLRHRIAAETAVTVSVGVASVRGGERNALILAADEALYRAKQRGRNCVEPAVDPAV